MCMSECMHACMHACMYVCIVAHGGSIWHGIVTICDVCSVGM